MSDALIVALNPSIDAEWHADEVIWEEKNNILSEKRWAGGKGINVTRWMRHLGNDVRLILPLGGRDGSELAAHLRAENISPNQIAISGKTRVNVIVTTRKGSQIRFNPLGPVITPGEWRKILRAVKSVLDRSELLILSGSLPRGLPDDAYAGLIRAARRAGVRTLLDCDGAPFQRAVEAQPFLVKPNDHELAAWFGRKLSSEQEIKKAANRLSSLTKGWVLVSCGAKSSHLIHAENGVFFTCKPPKLKPKTTVGAGDAMLAGVATEILKGSGPELWLKRGIEVGSAATQSPAGSLPVFRGEPKSRASVR